MIEDRTRGLHSGQGTRAQHRPFIDTQSDLLLNR
jgi:hypothetical protein